MITKIDIEWYKPFSRVEIPLLSPITAIGGRNNTGKTSLLEAIFLLFDRNNPELLLRSLGWRGFTQFKGSPERIFAHAFHDYDVNHDIRISALYKGHQFTLTFSYRRQGQQPSVRIEDLGVPSGPHSQSAAVSDAVDIRFTRDDDPGASESTVLFFGDGRLQFTQPMSRKGVADARYQGMRIRNSAAEDAELLGLLEIEGQGPDLLEFVRDFFPDIRSLTGIPSGGEPMIYADVGLPKKIPLPALGDGVARIVSYYLAAYGTRNGGVLLLDEVGAGIHHTLMPLLWRGLSALANRFSSQIVATSHSHECLSAALHSQDEIFPQQFSYVRLEQIRGSREVTVVPYRFEEFRSAVENDWEFR